MAKTLTFLTLILSSVDIYQEMTALLVFNSFKTQQERILS